MGKDDAAVLNAFMSKVAHAIAECAVGERRAPTPQSGRHPRRADRHQHPRPHCHPAQLMFAPPIWNGLPGSAWPPAYSKGRPSRRAQPLGWGQGAVLASWVHMTIGP